MKIQHPISPPEHYTPQEEAEAPTEYSTGGTTIVGIGIVAGTFMIGSLAGSALTLLLTR